MEITIHLKNLSDSVLLEETEKLVSSERETLTQILHYFIEIERRRLFASLGYKSLFDFALKKYKYSEDQVYRRLAAMNLLKEIPQLEEKLNSGAISLGHIGVAHSLFVQEKRSGEKEFSTEQKVELFERISDQTVREAARISFSMSTAKIQETRDKIRPISSDRVELKFLATWQLQEKIDELKGLLAHAKPQIALGDLFEVLCDLGLRQWKQKAPKSNNPISPTEIRRFVFQRAQHKCENCGSVYALEVDHIVPQAHGGLSDLENLRLLCRSCNQRAAIEKLGLEKMDKYIN